VLCNLHVIQTFVFTSIKHDSDQAENLHNMLPYVGKILHKFYGSHGNNLYVWFGNLQKAKQFSVCLQLQLFALLEITEVHEFAIFRS